MPPPTVAGVGAVASGTGAITPAFPAITFQAGDVNLTVAECEGVTAPGAYTLPSGWSQLDTISPVAQSTNTRLTVIWRRWQSGDVAPSLGDAGDHNLGRMLTIRGCPASGNPWNNVTPGTEATSDTSVLYPGTTTSIADCLVLEILACSADVASTTALSGHTNANYTSITEHIDNFVIAGNGGGIAVWSGIMASAGPTGQSTATLIATAAGFKAMMTLAMAPGAAAPAELNPQDRQGRRMMRTARMQVAHGA